MGNLKLGINGFGRIGRAIYRLNHIKEYFDVVSFFSTQPSKFLTSLLMIVAFFYFSLSISAIFEDYIHDEKIKNVANKGLYIFAIVIPLITIIIIFNLSI